MDIFPSLLTHTPAEFSTQLTKLLPHFDKMQIDIADNILVEGTTISSFEALQKLILNRYATNTTLDFHLMVRDYQKDLSLLHDAASKLKIRFALVHHAANPPIELFLHNSYSFRLGLVLNPEDDIDTIERKYELHKIPVIQLMTIIPGAQGKPFIPNVLNKIEQLRNINYRGIVMLDGAINETTLPIILHKSYLPDVVCPGSYFSKHEDIERRINALSSILHNSALGEEKA